MRKSIILASLLFGSSAFANLCGEPTGFVWAFEPPSYKSLGQDCDSVVAPTTCTSTTRMVKQYLTSGDGQNPSDPSNNCAVHQQIYNSSGITCPSNTTKDFEGVCRGVANPDLTPDPDHPLGDYDGNEAGCNGAGGYYMANGDCNTLGEAISDIFSSPYASVGAMLLVGGAIVGTGGMAALPLMGAAASAPVTVGIIGSTAGVGMMAATATNRMFNATPNTTSTDVSNGTQRIKLSLKDVPGGSASVVTNTSTTTKRVDSVSYIPPSVKAEMSKPEYVNKTDGTLSKPLPLHGVQKTDYNYSTNKATTTTHEAGSTSAAPITTTRVTNITVTQNTDGTVTTVPADTTIAPIVSGSGGGSVSTSGSSSWGTGSGTTSGAGTGTSSGDGTDYSGVLNDIKNNTRETADNTKFGAIPSLVNLNGDFEGNDDTTVLGDMYSSFTGAYDNLKGQIDSAKLVYDQTEDLISGGWTPPTIPLGECGTALTMNWHGKNVNMCESLVQFAPTISPVVSLFVTAGGILLSIAIFLGGF